MLRESSSTSSGNRSFNALKLTAGLCFTLFVTGTLVFTVLPATHHLRDSLFNPTAKITTTSPESTSNDASFESDIVSVTARPDEIIVCRVDDPINCHDPDVFHALLTAAIDKFKDANFFQFGKPVKGSNGNSCHMAWKYKPKEGNASTFYKDYRSFELTKSENCTVSVIAIGDYRSGLNAIRKKRENKGKDKENDPIASPVADQAMDGNNDVLFSMVESESSFSHEKYLLYSGGGDKCKNMNQYIWSFVCMLGEARYLNRTLVMDMDVCLSKIYTSSGRDEEGKDFRFYFDFEHLLDSAPVMDQAQFWSNWNTSQNKDGLSLLLVEDFPASSKGLFGMNHTLIMRKFGSVEPDNYWFRVCEGDNDSVIKRPWKWIWKSRPLMDIASAVAARMVWDFDAIRVERGEKVRNRERWPNLDRDTSPESIMETLRSKVEDGRNLYILTDEKNASFFDQLKERYSIHFLEEHKDLWDSNSDWEAEMRKLNNGNPVEFDGFMKESVEDEVFFRAKKRFETFNDLTKDCKDGVNTCNK